MLESVRDWAEEQQISSRREKLDAESSFDWELGCYDSVDDDGASSIAGEPGTHSSVLRVTGKANVSNSMKVKLGGSKGPFEDTDVMLWYALCAFCVLPSFLLLEGDVLRRSVVDRNRYPTLTPQAGV